MVSRCRNGGQGDRSSNSLKCPTAAFACAVSADGYTLPIGTLDSRVPPSEAAFHKTLLPFDSLDFPMRQFSIIFFILMLGGCQDDTTGSINSCKANSYTRFDPKDLKQCVDTCQKCDGGTPISCSTSCAIKGAH
jgi:hypothetical protein